MVMLSRSRIRVPPVKPGRVNGALAAQSDRLPAPHPRQLRACRFAAAVNVHPPSVDRAILIADDPWCLEGQIIVIVVPSTATRPSPHPAWRSRRRQRGRPTRPTTACDSARRLLQAAHRRSEVARFAALAVAGNTRSLTAIAASRTARGECRMKCVIRTSRGWLLEQFWGRPRRSPGRTWAEDSWDSCPIRSWCSA